MYISHYLHTTQSDASESVVSGVNRRPHTGDDTTDLEPTLLAAQGAG